MPAVTAATGGINLLIPLIAAGVGALVAGWIRFGDTIKDFLRMVWSNLLEDIGKGLKLLSKFVGIFHKKWADAMEEAGEGLKETAGEMKKATKVQVKATKVQKVATKEQVKATRAQKKSTKEQEKAEKAAKKSADAVQGLLDTWTGATLKSGEFLRAVRKLTTEQKANDRIMKQVNEKYASMRETLGPFDDELEAAWQATQRLNRELEAEKEALKAAAKAQKAATKAKKEATKAAEKAAKELKGLNDKMKEATRNSSKFNVALAAISGQMGGAAGQAFNLAMSMIQANKNLKEGEKGFSKAKVGAAVAASAFHTLGDAIGGAAGKALSAAGDIAQGFATGGWVGAAIAGIGHLIKGLKSLFTKTSDAEHAGRKVAHDFRQGIIEGLSPTQMAEVEQSWREGWDSSVKIAVRDAKIAAGATAEAAKIAADAAYQALWRAEKGGPEAVQKVMKSIVAIIDAGAAATEEAAKIEKARQKAALDALEETNAARLASITQAQEAQLEELKATQQRELDELAAARQAQLSVVEAAIQRELEDERIAAQLTIDLRKAGSDQKAIDAAHARARESNERLLERDELNALMAEAEARVRARYQDELDTINAHWDEKDAIVATHYEAELDNLERSHAAELDEIKLFNEAELALLKASIAAMNAVPPPKDKHHTITTTYVTRNESTYGGPGFGFGGPRQHGGPVSAGRRYLVGERGPEMFVPSQSGSIEPNGSSGGVDAKDLARAVAGALEGTRVEVDGRQLGRLTIRHQPMAVAELGGRR